MNEEMRKKVLRLADDMIRHAHDHKRDFGDSWRWSQIEIWNYIKKAVWVYDEDAPAPPPVLQRTGPTWLRKDKLK